MLLHNLVLRVPRSASFKKSILKFQRERYGISIHCNGEIVLEAVLLKIILVLLPANVAYLLQPFDVAVFKPFKARIDAVMREYNLNGGEVFHRAKKRHRLTITRVEEAKVFGPIVVTGNSPLHIGIMDKPANVVADNRACGIWPISPPQRRLKLYKDSEWAKDVELPSWLKVREIVQTEILVLPASSTKARKRRKTLDGNHQLFMREDLQNIDM